MGKNRYLQISENESLDLLDPLEKFKALTWICNEEHYSSTNNYLMEFITNKDLNEFIYSQDYHRIDLMEAVKSIFNIFGASVHSNFLSQYLLDYEQESNMVKKSRLNQLLKGLINFIEHHWENGASIMEYSIEKKDRSLIENNIEELYMFHYLMYCNLKKIYDLIWDYYSVFIDKEKFTFNYFYSHKENPQKEKLKNSTEDVIQTSRDEILNKLVNKGESHSLYAKYEKKLIREGFLNQDKNKWLKNAASLIRFYNYCEEKNIFKYFYKDNSQGVKYIRELYDFYDGSEIDSPSKRKKQNTKRQKFQFSFLNII